jgi:hypothetical protein
LELLKTWRENAANESRIKSTRLLKENTTANPPKTNQQETPQSGWYTVGLNITPDKIKTSFKNTGALRKLENIMHPARRPTSSTDVFLAGALYLSAGHHLRLTRGPANHHRQSVRVVKNDALSTEPRGHLANFKH